MITRRCLRVLLTTLAVGVGAAGVQAQDVELPPHSIDGLDAASGEILPELPRILAVFSAGVNEPIHRDFHTGGDIGFRAGGHLGGGWYLGGALAVAGNPVDGTVALPEGTWFQLSLMVTLDYVIPLRGARDPLGAGPALRIGVAPGAVRGMVQLSRSDKEDLQTAERDLAVQVWGGVVRTEVALELPVWHTTTSRTFLSFGLAYTWGLGEANSKLRDKTGAAASIREDEMLRLDALAIFVGVSVRL